LGSGIKSSFGGYRRLLTFLVLGGLLLFPLPASADVGIPMLALVWPASWALLLPVIVLEGLLARKVLQQSWSKSFWIAAAGNGASTLVGIPSSWAAVLMLGNVFIWLGEAAGVSGHVPIGLIFYVAWLPPGVQPWHFIAAAAILCVPFFFVSYGVEYSVAKRLLPHVSPKTVKRWSLLANGVTYGIIFVLLVVMAVIEY